LPAPSPSDSIASEAGVALTAAPPLIVIAGATGTGKTRVSLEVAEAVGNAQIISADSRQVFRGMDIGTAKVDTATRRRMQHHGLDLADPDEPFTVADFVRHAHAALIDISAASATAILVGGTGLYLRAVARGLPIGATGRDPEVRAELEERLTLQGLAPLVDRLRGVAPRLAAATDLANPRRVVRALERVAVSGDRPPPAPVGYPGPVLWLGLQSDPVEHRAAIAARAATQFADGLLEEAATLRESFGPTPGPFSAMGYREAFEVLDRKRTVDAAVEATAQRTWIYARRQRTWFRREPGVTWLRADDAGEISATIEAARAWLDAPRP